MVSGKLLIDQYPEPAGNRDPCMRMRLSREVYRRRGSRTSSTNYYIISTRPLNPREDSNLLESKLSCE